MKSQTILKRHPKNPLIVPEDVPGNIMQVFNPSPVKYKDKTILLLSVIPYANTGGETRLAVSDDGIKFEISDEPFIKLNKNQFPYTSINKHIIDSRVTEIDGVYYILTPIASSNGGPVGVLGKTNDFKSYKCIDVITQPQNRGASLFPEKINGKYYKLDRPGSGDNASPGNIWLSSSPDLIHWGCFKPVMNQRHVSWATLKIGPTPPIKTEKGWLTVIHGVNRQCSGTCYSIGAILLDLEKPWEVIGHTEKPILTPERDYEIKGWVPNTVFPCGAIADHDNDALRLYYGAADSRICLAEGSLSEIVEECMN